MIASRSISSSYHALLSTTMSSMKHLPVLHGNYMPQWGLFLGETWYGLYSHVAIYSKYIYIACSHQNSIASSGVVFPKLVLLARSEVLPFVGQIPWQDFAVVRDSAYRCLSGYAAGGSCEHLEWMAMLAFQLFFSFCSSDVEFNTCNNFMMVHLYPCSNSCCLGWSCVDFTFGMIRLEPLL